MLNDNIPIINILIEYGADPLIENEQGHLPSAYALSQRKELLSQYEQNVYFFIRYKTISKKSLRLFSYCYSRPKNYMKIE